VKEASEYMGGGRDGGTAGRGNGRNKGMEGLMVEKGARGTEE